MKNPHSSFQSVTVYLFSFIFLIGSPVFGQSLSASCFSCEEVKCEEAFTASSVNICTVQEGAQVTFRVCCLPELSSVRKLSRYTFFWDFGDGNMAWVDSLNEVTHVYTSSGPKKAKVQVTSLYSDDDDVDPESMLPLMRPGEAPFVSISIPAFSSTESTVGLSPTEDENPFTLHNPPPSPSSDLRIFPVRSLVPDAPLTFVVTLNQSLMETNDPTLRFEFDPAYFEPDMAWAYNEGENNPQEWEAASPGLFELDLSSVTFPPERPEHNLYVSIEGNGSLAIGQEVEFITTLGSASSTQPMVARSEHDPNFKRADAFFLCPGDRMPEEITYEVFFRNIGFMYADSIKITDYLPKRNLDAYTLDPNSIKVWIGRDRISEGPNAPGADLLGFYTYRELDDRIIWRIQEVSLTGQRMNAVGRSRVLIRDTYGKVSYTLKSSHPPKMIPIDARQRAIPSMASIKFGSLPDMPTGITAVRVPPENCCDTTTNEKEIRINLIARAKRIFLNAKPPIDTTKIFLDGGRNRRKTLRNDALLDDTHPRQFLVSLPPQKADTLVFWVRQPIIDSTFQTPVFLNKPKGFVGYRHHQIVLRICQKNPDTSPIPWWSIGLVGVLILILIIVLLLRSSRKKRPV